jgi:hypothetical protein
MIPAIICVCITALIWLVVILRHVMDLKRRMAARKKLDLRYLNHNSSEDLQILMDAVNAQILFIQKMPWSLRADSDIQYRYQTLIGWKMMIQGSYLDVSDREANEAVRQLMKEVEKVNH